jgi:hypothetical protein
MVRAATRARLRTVLLTSVGTGLSVGLTNLAVSGAAVDRVSQAWPVGCSPAQPPATFT